MNAQECMYKEREKITYDGRAPDRRAGAAGAFIVASRALTRRLLYDAGSAIGILPRYSRRDGEADGRANLDEFLLTQPPPASDQPAPCVRLVHDALQQAQLAHNVERRCVVRRRVRVSGRRRRTQLNVDDRRGSVLGNLDRLDTVEHREDCVDNLLQRIEDRQRLPPDVDALRSGD